MTKVLDRARVLGDFHAAVNMDARALEEWLRSPESLSVGQMKPDGESIGHASGRRIVEILGKDRARLPTGITRTCARWSAMSGGTGLRSRENMVSSRWRYSLMNWATTR